MQAMEAPKQGTQSPKKRNPKKKLKSIKKLKSFPQPGADGSKQSVEELLQKAMHKSCSMTDVNSTVLVPHSRLKINLEAGYDNQDEMDSQMSPGRGSLMNSFRSWSSTSMDGSEITLSTRRTQRELVHEIKQRAERNLGPPSYVTPLQELQPRQLSWNHKVPQNFNPLKPQVNIIGCQHPMELILAQADSRSRHRQETLELRQKLCDEKVKAIDEAIQLKYTRAERYALMLEHKQRQVEWMKIIKICTYISRLSTETRHHVVTGSFFNHSVRAALVIRKACKRFMKRHLLHKFKFKFMVLFRKREFVFRMGLRINRKHIAVNKIKTFLAEFRNHHRMNVVVHKYLTGVRKVQQNIRDFLCCKHAKVFCLAVLWARLERGYVKKMLEKRKEQKRSTGKMSTQESDMATFDRKTLIEMKNQAKLWERIDNKMEDRIKSLKATGVIVIASEDEEVDKYMLPTPRRWAALNEMLQFLRKEFYQSQRAVIRKKMDAEAAFTEHHALDLLRGRNEDISRIVQEKFDKKLVSLKYKPFMLFSSISHKLIMDRIIQAHNLNQTFAIKINDFSAYSGSSKVNRRAGAGAGAAGGSGQEKQGFADIVHMASNTSGKEAPVNVSAKLSGKKISNK